jgi:hypothetical protein
MRHLVGHVLSEPDFLRVHADFEKELLNTSKEVTEGFIVNETGGYSMTNLGGLNVGLTRQLDVSVEEFEFYILDFIETWVLLAALGIDEVLNLGHEEFSYTKKAGSGRNFVSEGFTDGCGGKGHLLLVEFEELCKVQELALGSLRSQVTRHVRGGSD